LAALALIAALACPGAPVSAAESASTTTQPGPIPTSQAIDALGLVPAPDNTVRFGPTPRTPAKPTARRKRRRHHFWLWHLVPGSGGPLSWLLLVPYLIVGLGVAVVVILVRRRRTKASSAPSHAILDPPTDIHPVEDRPPAPDR
jgi:hypothetical protein